MINLTKNEPAAMSEAEAAAHHVHLGSYLRVLRAWQEENPTVADYRVTGMIEHLDEAVEFARQLAHGERLLPPES